MNSSTPKKKGNSSSTRKRIRELRQKIPSIRSLTRKNCPPGMIQRKSYTRRYSTAVRKEGFLVKKKSGKEYRIFPKVSDMLVKPRCIKNLGKPGKGPQQFGALKKGELAKYGYSFRRKTEPRRAALKEAVKHYGLLGVYRKLDAVAKLTKRINPRASEVFTADREWVHALKQNS